MFELFPFPGTIVYSPLSPVTRSPSGSGSTTQDTAQGVYQCASPMSPLRITDTGQIVDFMDEMSSDSHLPNTVLAPATFPSSGESEPSSAAQRTSLEQQEFLSNKLRKRKGHKKSRNGCYNCKKRKIKASHAHHIPSQEAYPFSVLRTNLLATTAPK